jgi:hypothetical protein
LQKLGIPRPTFYRWYAAYRAGGPERLEDDRGAMEVPSRQCQSQEPSKCLSSHPLEIVTEASCATSLWFTGQRQAEPSGALRGEPPIGTGLTL